MTEEQKRPYEEVCFFGVSIIIESFRRITYYVTLRWQRGEKTGVEVKKNDVKGKENQEKGKKLMVQNKEIEDQEKEKERGKEIENEKNEKEEKNKISKKSRSGRVVDKGVEVPYPVVPSKKEKDHHLARFLDIFRKLEITMPFGEAL